MNLKFVGVRRKTEFSPNHIENDLQIINRTAENLMGLGAQIEIIDEADLSSASLDGSLIFSMAQGPAGTKALNRYAQDHRAFIINSPESVANCYRVNMVKLLPQAGIAFPRSVIIKTDSSSCFDYDEIINGKIWVKRGDVHAVHREDVALAYNRNEATMILREFHQRGIATAILQENVDGDTVKFYAVRESSFFHWYYLNGICHAPFDEKELRCLALRSAEILGLYVYGGDAIIGKDGSIIIIDINDWPSFAPVRDKASEEIARLVYHKGEEFCNGRRHDQKSSN
jgi:glutathione synthase/RimK-type ligase-like ATP-grasp enzyme